MSRMAVRMAVDPKAAYQQIDYMPNNPVRRQLCAKPEDWRWSGAAEYAGLTPGPLRMTRDWLPPLVET
jgi:putative transposase